MDTKYSESDEMQKRVADMLGIIEKNILFEPVKINNPFIEKTKQKLERSGYYIDRKTQA